jgi:glycogen debranching enzyme
MTDEVLLVDERFAIVATRRRSADPPRVLKRGDTFGVFDRHGDVDGTEEHGLYHHGTRFLSTLVLLLARNRPLLLSSTISHDNVAFVADLTNLDICRDGHIELPHGALHLLRTRVLGDGVCVERLRIWNHSERAVEIPLSVGFDADFADVFEVRGMKRHQRGTRLGDRPGDEYVMTYVGLDKVERRTRIRWSRQPDTMVAGQASFLLRLAPREPVTIEMTVICEDDGASPFVPAGYDAAVEDARRVVALHTARGCKVRTSHESLNRWLRRASADLEMMLTDTKDGLYPYAGIPWFSTPFGRDGVITALELLWLQPDIARGVLTFLASTQATSYSDAQDAEPGKIVHEMRRGEMAALGEIPFGRYYGSIDSTPLFVMLAHGYFRRTGDRAFIAQLWPHVVAALGWMERDGDVDQDGFLEYQRRSPDGLIQQGWRDSHDSVFHAHGELAEPPIALCEVQAYAYAAWRGGAALAAMMRDRGSARKWNAKADHLRRRFDEFFWCPDIGTYAVALDGRKEPCRVRSSSPAQCLLTGIVSSRARARRVADVLMEDASFCGWGVRTIAAGAARYNPMSYHNGSVWPHDNALAAAGLAKSGFTSAATRIFDAMLDLSEEVDLHRLPELICGFHRRSDERPTLYPVACAPQAWAAGAVYLFLQASLGMDVDAERRQISFRHAVLPERVDRMFLNNLTVGSAQVDLMLERHANDVSVSVIRRSGKVDIVALE